MSNLKKLRVALADAAVVEINKQFDEGAEFVYLSEAFNDKNWDRVLGDKVRFADSVRQDDVYNFKLASGEGLGRWGGTQDWNSFDDRKAYNMKAAMKCLADRFEVRQSGFGKRYKIYKVQK